jgi:diguanylate cyclase
MKKTKTFQTNLSIRMMIIISFTIIILTTGSLIGSFVFSNLLSSANEAIAKIAKEMNEQIYYKIDMLVNIPGDMIKANQGLIENGIVDIRNDKEREKFFVGVLSNSSDDVYSFSYGTEDGYYYGARRNENNSIEIMKNNADTDGHSWYYSTAEDMTSIRRVMDAGEFDPRTRDWYVSAKETQKPMFSPIYKHFVMNDLALSAGIPVYNKTGELQGVLGSHVTLSRINHYLKEITKDKSAVSVIIEKESKELVANSLDLPNFTTLKNGSIKRLTIDEIDNPAIIQAFKNYNKNGTIYSQINGNHINISEYQKGGLQWLVFTAVPESLYAAGIIKNMQWTIFLTIVALLLAMTIFLKLINKYLKPIDYLIDTAEKFSQGDLLQRVVINRDDEIGRIGESFNKMADTIFMLINNLEKKVKERTMELEQTNNKLKENKGKLRLILNSTAEGIYGMDIHGNCTFCNASGLKLLGYSHQEELYGKNMHYLVHHSYKDGRVMPLSECKVYKALQTGSGTNVDDEVFWRKDGKSFSVEYHSYPQYKEGKVVGVVVTFMDNTERKKNEDYIKYLSYHDSLTGLYNRMFFETELEKLDSESNLPLSIIYGDVNGLKLTNDIFGHAWGDALLQKSAKILKRVCREKDVVARVGGDEFAVLLPSTNFADAVQIVDKIKKEFSEEQIFAIKGSISMGCATKTRSDQKIKRTIELAEDRMYKEKMLNRKAINSNMINTIMETLYNKNPKERLHSQAVSELCQKIGQAMKMPETYVRKLKEAGYLHDIGKIVLNDGLLKNEDGTSLTDEENREFEQHPIIGYRILNLFEDTMDLAEGVLYHHENWNGTGYPKGLKEKEIPVIARIIKVAESYYEITNSLDKNPLNKEAALQEIKKQSGILFDPDIVDIFIQLKNM